MKHLFYLLVIVISLTSYSCNTTDKIFEDPEIPETPNKEESGESNGTNTESLNSKITIGEQILTATMNDHVTVRDFLSQLPMTITMTDFNSTEKIFYMPNNYNLSTTDAPFGCAPAIGDITLYAPWGNIAIFYKAYSYSSSLIPMGKIDGDGIKHLQASGSLTATIERL